MRIKSLSITVLLLLSLHAQSTTFTLTLRGVYDSDVNLTAYEGQYFSNELANQKGVIKGLQFEVPPELLPGQFLIQFSYRKSPTDKPSSSQLMFFLNKYDLEYNVNPAYTQYDSIIHGPDPENELFYRVIKESPERKAPIALLEQVLTGYDLKQSKFYSSALKEYKTRVYEHNEWINGLAQTNSELFVSRHFILDLIPWIDWSLPEEEVFNYQAYHYFDHVGWSDSLLIRTSSLSLFMTNYIQLFARKAVTKELADSLFTQAGSIACNKASSGDPLVYGWMVDFFYMGYEQLGIEPGMKMLQTHLANPNCRAQSSGDIMRRLEGMQRLVKESKAPDFTLNTSKGQEFNLYGSVAPTPYILLLFWSADCEHCLQTADELSQWQQSSSKASKVAVVAISMDSTPEEVAQWNEVTPMLPSWIHLRAPEGMGSKVAFDYVVLSTPALFLLNSADYTIASVPLTVSELDKAIVK